MMHAMMKKILKAERHKYKCNGERERKRSRSYCSRFTHDNNNYSHTFPHVDFSPSLHAELRVSTSCLQKAEQSRSWEKKISVSIFHIFFFFFSVCCIFLTAFSVQLVNSSLTHDVPWSGCLYSLIFHSFFTEKKNFFDQKKSE